MVNRTYQYFFVCCFVALFLSGPLYAQDSGGSYPPWVEQWRTWAYSTKNPIFIDWAETLSTPEAIKLGKKWEEFLGYNAVDLVARDKKAPNIKPGIIITPKNIAIYEKELRQLFPFGFDWEVDRLTGKGVYAQYNFSPLEMIIVPTTHAWNDRGFLEATRKYSAACRVNQTGGLEGWVAGIPFPFPTSALEIVHNYDRLTVMADNLNSMPMSIGLYGKDGIAPCLTLDGKINPDGSSLLKAKGLTGNPASTIKNVNKGTPYSYNINAVFSDFKGTGTRIGNRVCNVIFVKQ